MAKIHKNAEKFPIKWNGDVEGGDKQNDNIPSNLNVTWNAGRPVIPYVSCHTGTGGASNCTDNVNSYFFEDFDVDGDGVISVADLVAAVNQGAPSSFINHILGVVIFGSIPIPPNGPTSLGTDATETEFTWGDVNFIQEIMDGIGSGSRRARQDRLNKILDDEDKKKKLIHLICRIKGEKVYDDYTEVGSVEVDVDDVELVVERMMGKKLKLEIKSGV